MKDIFSDAQSRLDDVFHQVAVSDEIGERLHHPKLSLAVSVPVRMDDGSLRVFQGYRVQFGGGSRPLSHLSRWRAMRLGLVS